MDPFSFGAITLGGLGAVAYRYFRRGKIHRDWSSVLTEAAQRLNGHASIGNRFDAPQLRTNIDGASITISFKDTHRANEKGTAISEVKVNAKAEQYRLYFGWNVQQLRKELTYIPEVELQYGFGLPTPNVVRANDRAFAEQLLKYAANDIVDVKREANAHGIEFLLRAGGLRFAVHGIERSSWMVERLATATARIAKGIEFCLDTQSGENAVLSPVTVRERQINCRLCTSQIQENQKVLRCNRCNAAYHDHCFRQATGCIVDQCFETRATPE
jgi:hypothetical protein